MPYGSMTILCTNHKINKTQCYTKREDDAIRVRRRFLHDSLSPLMVISLVFLELVEQIELALPTYLTF